MSDAINDPVIVEKLSVVDVVIPAIPLPPVFPYVAIYAFRTDDGRALWNVTGPHRTPEEAVKWAERKTVVPGSIFVLEIPPLPLRKA